MNSKIRIDIVDYWFNDKGQIIAEVLVDTNGAEFVTRVLLNNTKEADGQ